MFFFSPWRSFLPFVISTRLSLGSKRDLSRRVPFRQTHRRFIGITRQLNSARVNFKDVVNQSLVVIFNLPRRLSRDMVGDPLPPIRQVRRNHHQSLLEKLVLRPSPLSRRLSHVRPPTVVKHNNQKQRRDWLMGFSLTEKNQFSWRFRIWVLLERFKNFWVCIYSISHAEKESIGYGGNLGIGFKGKERERKQIIKEKEKILRIWNQHVFGIIGLVLKMDFTLSASFLAVLLHLFGCSKPQIQDGHRCKNN